jgi:hypothetical protein
MRNIDFIREVTHTAAGQWQSVLSGLNIARLIHRSSIPPAPRAEEQIASGSTTTSAGRISAISVALAMASTD